MTKAVTFLGTDADGAYTDDRQVVVSYIAGGSITAKDFVALDTTATNAGRANKVVQAAVVATGNPLAIGVALEAASAGDAVQVCVQGYVEGANVATATASGDPLIVGGTTAGRAETAAATDVCPIIGVALEAGSSNTADVWLYGIA